MWYRIKYFYIHICNGDFSNVSEEVKTLFVSEFLDTYRYSDSRNLDIIYQHLDKKLRVLLNLKAAREVEI